MNLASEYLAPALGDLRYLIAARPESLSDRDDPMVSAALEALDDSSSDYAAMLIAEHHKQLENFYYMSEEQKDRDRFEAAPTPDFTLPSLVATEIGDVATQIRELEMYLKCLVIFAHRFAVDELNQSELSRLSRATRVTIGRWLSDEKLSEAVAEVASSNAAGVLARRTPADVKDRESAAALGVLRWYASAGAHGTGEADDTEPSDGSQS